MHLAIPFHHAHTHTLCSASETLSTTRVRTVRSNPPYQIAHPLAVLPAFCKHENKQPVKNGHPKQRTKTGLMPSRAMPPAGSILCSVPRNEREGKRSRLVFIIGSTASIYARVKFHYQQHSHTHTHIEEVACLGVTSNQLRRARADKTVPRLPDVLTARQVAREIANSWRSYRRLGRATASSVGESGEIFI